MGDTLTIVADDRRDDRCRLAVCGDCQAISRDYRRDDRVRLAGGVTLVLLAKLFPAITGVMMW